jgi:multisubunit Na+/H+ antiporter MnhF subunit
MAVYKVIQDIEAEDKLVGFLTLKTFIYAIIAVVLAYLNFRIAITPSL